MAKFASGLSKWRAKITFNGPRIHLGLYPSARDAGLAYDMAAPIIHGPFSCLNFPVEESDNIQLSPRSLAHINRAMSGDRLDVLTSMRERNCGMPTRASAQGITGNLPTVDEIFG